MLQIDHCWGLNDQVLLVLYFHVPCFGQMKLPICSVAKYCILIGKIQVINFFKSSQSENPNTAVAFGRLVLLTLYRFRKKNCIFNFLMLWIGLIFNYWSFVNLYWHVKNTDVQILITGTLVSLLLLAHLSQNEMRKNGFNFRKICQKKIWYLILGNV